MDHHNLILEFNDLICSSILKHNGVIFGGYIRDHILRNHCISEFNKVFNPTCVDYDTTFSNLKILPELRDRMIVSNDIDCLITKRRMNAILNELRYDHNLCIRKVFKRDPCKYIPSFNEIDSGNYCHYRYCIQSYNPNILNQLKFLGISNSVINDIRYTKVIIKITVDFIVCLDNKLPADPFLVPIDFKCNGFYVKKTMELPLLTSQISSHSDCISENYKRLKSIYDNIYNKVAVCVSPDKVRINKMVMKGYKITQIPICSPFTIIPDSHDDVCIICLSDLATNHIVTNCCKTHLHHSCYDELYLSSISNTIECPICK